MHKAYCLLERECKLLIPKLCGELYNIIIINKIWRKLCTIYIVSFNNEGSLQGVI